MELDYTDCLPEPFGHGHSWGAPHFGAAPDAELFAHGPEVGGHDTAGLRFGSWEQWPSGYWYEYDPGHNYTGNWSS